VVAGNVVGISEQQSLDVERGVAGFRTLIARKSRVREDQKKGKKTDCFHCPGVRFADGIMVHIASRIMQT
jgi:hypothetical protein